MTAPMSPEVVCKEIVTFLAKGGFVPRDADGNDLQRGDDRALRFKVGTSYKEVAVQVVRYGKADPQETLRITSMLRVGRAKLRLAAIVEAYDQAKDPV